MEKAKRHVDTDWGNGVVHKGEPHLPGSALQLGFLLLGPSYFPITPRSPPRAVITCYVFLKAQ